MGIVLTSLSRAVARSENTGGGGLLVLSGYNVLSLVEIGLTDLAKTSPPACNSPAVVKRVGR